MGTLIVIIYRLGLVAIWLGALGVGAVTIGLLADNLPLGIGLIIIIAVLIVGVIAHLLWRWILGQE